MTSEITPTRAREIWTNRSHDTFTTSMTLEEREYLDQLWHTLPDHYSRFDALCYIMQSDLIQDRVSQATLDGYDAGFLAGKEFVK